MKKLNTNPFKLKFSTLVLSGIVGATLLFGSIYSFTKAVDYSLYSQLSGNVSNVNPGDNVVYEVKVRNDGTQTLSTVRVNQNFNSLVSYVPGSTVAVKSGTTINVDDGWTGAGGFNFGTLTPGQTGVLKFTGKISTSVTPGTSIQNAVAIRSDQTDWVGQGFTVTVILPNTVLRGGNFLKVTNNTLQNGWQDSVTVGGSDVVEFLTKISNDGTVDAKNVSIKANLPATAANPQNPSVTLAANNAPSVTDNVTVTGQRPFYFVYKVGHATLFGVTELYNCPTGCRIPEHFYISPLNIGTVKKGESMSIQVTFKADIYTPASPTATPTRTPTATPTRTPSPTPRPTPTRTPTATPTRTPTSRPTPTRTPTATPRVTPTTTPRITPTATPRVTPTATPRVTPTATPRITPTATPRVTPTATPRITPTATPRVTHTPSPTPSPTKSPSPTPMEESKLKICKYDDDNGNGVIDEKDFVLDWNFMYSYKNQEYKVSHNWWDIFNRGCVTVKVPVGEWINVREENVDNWFLTNIYSDGNKVGGSEFKYVSYANTQKEVWFLNHHVEKSETPTPTPTITPTPSNIPNSCNGTCGSNINCASGLFCYQGYCRNPSCQTESSCGCPGATTTPRPPEVLSATAPPVLPKTGADPVAVSLGLSSLISGGIYLYRKFKLV
jgi:uncharacterized repeat protein (TIGR01451 family)